MDEETPNDRQTKDAIVLAVIMFVFWTTIAGLLVDPPVGADVNPSVSQAIGYWVTPFTTGPSLLIGLIIAAITFALKAPQENSEPDSSSRERH